MNEDALERLLIDRHLGELEPDTAALLAAYLAADGQLERPAALLAETIELAGRVMRKDAPAFDRPMPRLAAPKNLHRVHHGPRWIAWTRRVAVAAAVVAAFLLGQLAGPTDVHQVAVVPEPLPVSTTTTQEPSGGFWSLQRLREARPAKQAPRRRRIEWTTPLRQPRIGERT